MTTNNIFNAKLLAVFAFLSLISVTYSANAAGLSCAELTERYKDPNASGHPNARHMTRLATAAAAGCLKLVEDLVRAGAEIDEDAGGQTALVKAVIFERASVVRFLAEAGADLNHDDGNGNLLKHCIYARKYEILQILLEAGADMHRPSSNGASAFDLAKYKGDPITLSIMAQVEADLNVLAYLRESNRLATMTEGSDMTEPEQHTANGDANLLATMMYSSEPDNRLPEAVAQIVSDVAGYSRQYLEATRLGMLLNLVVNQKGSLYDILMPKGLKKAIKENE